MNLENLSRAFQLNFWKNLFRKQFLLTLPKTFEIVFVTVKQEGIELSKFLPNDYIKKNTGSD
jgi:hypothetical protein